MKYESLKYDIDKDEAESILEQEDESKSSLVLVSICHIDDFRWACNVYLKYIHHHNVVLARAAIIGVGHLARLSSQFHIKKKIFIKELNKVVLNRLDIRETVCETLSEIELFTKNKSCKVRNTKK